MHNVKIKDKQALIMNKIKKIRIILPLLVILLGVGLMVGLGGLKKPPEKKEEVDLTPLVSVKTVELTDYDLKVRSFGNVSPKYQTQLTAQVEGVIVKLADAFNAGGLVKKGDLIAQIDPSDYRANLIEAEANLASAKAGLALEQAQGKQARLESKKVANLAPSELALRQPQLAQATARVKAAEAAQQRAKRNLERTEVRAPFDALITARHVSLGSFVNKSGQIGELSSTEFAEIRLAVSSQQLKLLRSANHSGQSVIGTTVDLYQSDAPNTLYRQAKIVRTEGSIDMQSRLHFFVAQIDDPYLLSETSPLATPKSATSKPNAVVEFGRYVIADIHAHTVNQVALVKSEFVKNQQVAVLDEDQTLTYKKVHVLKSDGGISVVSQGLKAGDQIITSALQYPLQGMQLKLNNTDKNSSGDASAISENSEG